ncbi:PAS domain S-box protein [Micromonospora sp. STR1s_5]|nr:PAS domain S-box protein [Micromonospora sp. STR1s_5]
MELRTLVGVLLGSRQPMFLTWGTERTLLYNDRYAEILGRKAPGGLGRPFFEVWSEVRSDLQPLVDQVDAGHSVHMDDIALVLERHGDPEEAHFAFSYTPVRDESGRVAGIFCPCTETTAQVLAERRSVAERERLTQLFDQAPGFMAMLRGPEHVFELVNRAYLQLIGHRYVLGKPAREALPEVEGQGFFEILDRVYLTGEAFTGTALKVGLQRSSGAPAEDRFIDLVYQPVTDANGRVIGIFAEGSDVTERVRAEEALREREERLWLVVEGAKDHAILTTDDVGRITSWSAGAEAIFGWTADEAIGVDAGIIYTPEDRADGADRQELKTAALEGGALDERWHVRKDGSRVFMNGTLRPLHDGQGRARGFIKVAQDETERRRAVDALRHLNDTLEQQVEERTRDRDRMWRLSTDVMLVARLDATIVAINPAWTSLLGWAEEELLGRSFMELVHPDDVLATEAEAGRLSQGMTTLRFENRYRSKDGSYRWLSWIAVPDDDLLHGVGRDVTAEKQAAEALRETEEALRQAQKMEAVGQLTGGIAHDFNNLLAGIVGSLDLMQTRIAQGRTESLERYAKAAMSSAQRAAALTHRLLAFSRRQPLDPKPSAPTSSSPRWRTCFGALLAQCMLWRS